LLVERNHGAAAVILILAGVGAMANVNRPETETDSAAEDFNVWDSGITGFWATIVGAIRF
jgi:hypothetical protein